MCSGEQNAFACQLVQSRARNVGVTVNTEIPAQIVPMHNQHIVSLLVGCVVVADCRHLLSLWALLDVIGSGAPGCTAGRIAAAAGCDIRAVSGSRRLRRIPARTGRVILRRLRLAVVPLPAAVEPAGSGTSGRLR